MVQFNLLPDIKLDYVKKQRSKRVVMMGAFGITGLCVFVLILLFMIVNVFQKQHIDNLNSDITEITSELESIPELDKVLTVQNQLSVLNGLHEAKPATQRLYQYLIQLTPKDAKIAEVTVNFEENTISLEGSATSLQLINKFVDTIKFTEFQYDETKQPAFSDVVLSRYGISQGGVTGADRTSYTIDLVFDPVIFDNTKPVTLVIPPIISTRSVSERPQDLFEAKPVQDQQNGEQ